MVYGMSTDPKKQLTKGLPKVNDSSVPMMSQAPNMSTVNGPAVGGITKLKPKVTLPSPIQSSFAGINAPTIGSQFGTIKGAEKTISTPETIQSANISKPVTTTGTAPQQNISQIDYTQTIGELGATILANPDADVEETKAKFPEFSHIDTQVFGELGATIQANPDMSIDEVMQKFPELTQEQTTEQTAPDVSPILLEGLDKLDSYEGPLKSVVKGMSSYIRGLAESANVAGEGLKNIAEKGKEVNLQAVKNDVTQELFKQRFGHQFDPNNKDDVLKAKTITDVENTQEYKDYLSKLQTEQAKIDESSTSANILDVAQGTLGVGFSTFAPQTMLGMNVAGQTKVGGALLEGFGSLIEQGGSVINIIPGLKQFKESLPEEKRAEFDSYIGNMAFMMVMGTKGKKNIVKDPMKFIKDNANPAEIIQNFQTAVLGIPGKIVEGVAKIPEKASNVFKKTTEGVDNVDRIASNIFGLDAETISTMRKYPEIIKAIEEGKVSKEGIKEDLLNMVDDVDQQKGTIGKEYQQLYSKSDTFDSVGIQNTLRTNLESRGVRFNDNGQIEGFDITNRALANTPQGELNLIKSQYNMIIDSLKDKQNLNIEQLHNVKRTLGNAQYTEGVKTKKSPILKEMSNVINEKLSQVEGRKETDVKFSKKAKELREIAELITTKGGEFKGTLRALLGERQYGRLQDMEKIYPGLTKKLEAIKAYDDYLRTRDTKKVGDYGKVLRGVTGGGLGAALGGALLGGFGTYFGGFLGAIIANHLTDPKVFKDFIIKNIKDGDQIVNKLNKGQTLNEKEIKDITEVLVTKKPNESNTADSTNSSLKSDKPTQGGQETTKKSLQTPIKEQIKSQGLKPKEGIPTKKTPLNKIDNGLKEKASSEIPVTKEMIDINGNKYTIDQIKQSGAYKSIVDSLESLNVKGYTTEDVINMLKETQKSNRTNVDWNREITKIEDKYKSKPVISPKNKSNNLDINIDDNLIKEIMSVAKKYDSADDFIDNTIRKSGDNDVSSMIKRAEKSSGIIDMQNRKNIVDEKLYEIKVKVRNGEIKEGTELGIKIQKEYDTLLKEKSKLEMDISDKEEKLGLNALGFGTKEGIEPQLRKIREQANKSSKGIPKK